MEEATRISRTILQYASQDALAPMTAQLLSRLGYRIVMSDVFEALRKNEPELEADLLLVDERRLGDLDREEDDLRNVPIVLLSGRHGATGADSRIVGAAKRPAGLHELYRLMQQVFEDTPRTTPRIATQLSARCEMRDGSHWQGRVVSLSENGCLLRTPEAILLGQTVHLEIALPQAGMLSIDGEAAYQLLPDTGLVFSAIDPQNRESLGRFVAQTIMAA